MIHKLSKGLPFVIGVALSAGSPVISYDCVAGPSDMIEDGANGFLIPVGDEYTFKKKLSMLMNNKEIRNKMKRHSAIKIRENSVGTISEKFHEFILSSK